MDIKEYIPDRMQSPPANYPQALSNGEVLRRFRALVGDAAAPRKAPCVEVLSEELLPGNIVRQKIAYKVDENERVTALHLFHQDLPPNAPGILSIHEHGGDENFLLGKELHCKPLAGDPTQYSYWAATEGFRVLAPDALCFGERRASYGYASNFMDEIVTHAELCARGKSLAWKSIYDNSRAVEVLQALGCGSVGVLGHSGGSTQGYLLMAANSSVQAAACCYSFATLREQFYRYRCWHCLYHYIPGMIEAGIDFDQVVATIAPRPLFMGWGSKDEGTPESMYRAFVKAYNDRCAQEALPNRLVCHEGNTGHVLTVEMLRAIMQFFHQTLY